MALSITAMFLAIHLVLPQVAGLEATARQLARATWWLAPAVVVLEAASFLAYGELVLVILHGARQAAPRSLIQRATIVGTSLGKTLPGGGTTALAVIVGALSRNGLDPAKATTSLAASGALSAAILSLLLPVGSVLAIASGETVGLALGVAGVATAILFGVALLPVAFRHPGTAAKLVGRLMALLALGPLRRWVSPERVAARVETGLRSARIIADDRRTVARAGVYAAANWLLDAGAFAVLAATIGRGTPLAPLLLAYVIGQFLGAIPITPGGVGFVETGMTGALVAAGAPAAAATAAVLGWRLISHWLPIAVGLALLPTVVRRSGEVTGPQSSRR